MVPKADADCANVLEGDAISNKAVNRPNRSRLEHASRNILDKRLPPLGSAKRAWRLRHSPKTQPRLRHGNNRGTSNPALSMRPRQLILEREARQELHLARRPNIRQSALRLTEGCYRQSVGVVTVNAIQGIEIQVIEGIERFCA